jgi:biotin operon repressor
MTKRYRRRATFAASWQFRALDRNQRARIMHLAEVRERKTKPKGKKNGALHGPCGLHVLRTLLFAFMNAKTGQCDPSYDDLEARTGYCRDTVAKCVKALEASGLLIISRRMVRVIVDGVLMPRQISNAYGFGELRIVTGPTLDGQSGSGRAFPAKALPLERWLKSLQSSASLNRREQPPQDLKKGFSGGMFAAGCAS